MYVVLYYTNNIGNKCDKTPAFDLTRCEEYAKSINAFYFQTRYYALYIILYYTMTYCDIPQGIMLYYTCSRCNILIYIILCYLLHAYTYYFIHINNYVYIMHNST